MHSLKLTGPVLTAVMDVDGKPTVVDVTRNAHQFLFEPVKLDDVKLADIFALLDLDPVLVKVLRRNFAEELLEHARKGPLKHEAVYGPEELEYLELYQILELNTHSKVMENMSHIQFHGVGFELREDHDMGGYTQPKGSRVHWGISLSDLREFLHLPVRVKEEVLVCEGDYNAKAFGSELQSFRREQLTLGEVLNGVLWELSFHGAPSDIAETAAELKERHEEVKEAIEREKNGEPSQFISGADIFESFDKPGVDAMFESTGSMRACEVTRALRELEDDENVVSGLARVLGDQAAELKIRAQHQGLGARAFRTALSEARRTKG